MKTRKIRWTLFKETGKWYASGDAYINPDNQYLFMSELLNDIATSQDVVTSKCIIDREFILVVDGDEGNPDTHYPFISRLFPAKEN